jgi:hypothetical protein
VHYIINNVRVYHDSDITEWHFNSLFELSHYSFHNTHTRDLDEFLTSPQELKFAAYHVPFPHNNNWLEKFEQTYQVADHTIVFCSELHQSTVEQLQTLDRPNVTIFIAGFFNFSFTSAKILRWMDWFITTGHFYREHNPTLLPSKLVPQHSKPKLFDILLGCQRHHRDFIHNYITNNNLIDQSIMTYHRRWNIDLRQSEYIPEVDGIEYLETPQHTIHQVRYYGYRMTLSQVVPILIYNQTYYSVVAETNAVNEFNFYTEKIVKPILAGRMFIVIAGKDFLKNLRTLGFKTFDSIIDESYDSESDSERRWSMALDQVKYLSTIDPADVYIKIKDIVEHNRQLMLAPNWYKEFSQQLLEEIDPYLDSGHITAG